MCQLKNMSFLYFFSGDIYRHVGVTDHIIGQYDVPAAADGSTNWK
jgi:hypothetical protein